jgi:hypothetical protein
VKSPRWDKNNIPCLKTFFVAVSVNDNALTLDDIVECTSGQFPAHAKCQDPLRVEILTLCLQECDLEKPSPIKLIQRE